jgi:predicted DNA-binding protein
MTQPSTTIRVSVTQRERLRKLAEQRAATMSDTLDDALEALRRAQFYADMANAEAALRTDPAGWAQFVAEREAWLDPDAENR